MSLKVINNIECVDVKHEAPRIITIKSCDQHKNIFGGPHEYIELEVDNTTYRVLARDLITAADNATRSN